MSFQTGKLLSYSENLEQFLAHCTNPHHSNTVRTFKILINVETEQLVLAKIKDNNNSDEDEQNSFQHYYYPINRNWQQDYQAYIPKLISNQITEPCYILFQIQSFIDDTDNDGNNNNNQQWVFIHYCPETCSRVRAKMLYSSGKFQLKQHFGSNHIVLDHFADSEDGLKFEIFLHKLQSKLISSVKDDVNDDYDYDEMLNIKSLNIGESSKSSQQQQLKNSNKISFNFTNEALKAVQEFDTGKLDHIKLTIGPTEQIQLAAKIKSSKSNKNKPLNINVNEHLSLPLLSIINNHQDSNNDSSPAFHLLRLCYLEHLPQKQPSTKYVTILIVVIPMSTKVRQRFIYSSAVASLQQTFYEHLTHPEHRIVKRIEVDDPAEVTFGYVASKLLLTNNVNVVIKSSDHQNNQNSNNQDETNKLKFTKPPPQTGRKGIRRLIK